MRYTEGDEIRERQRSCVDGRRLVTRTISCLRIEWGVEQATRCNEELHVGETQDLLIIVTDVELTQIRVANANPLMSRR